MTPEQAAAAARPSVLRLGGEFRESAAALGRARGAGLSNWAFYVVGRAGALGDVSAGTAAAALGLITPEAVADGWEAARRVSKPEAVAARSLAECVRWGAEHLRHAPGAARLAELAARVVNAADAAGMPLFAAWRAMPLPDAPAPGRAAAQLSVLSELVAGAQLIATRASGLSPLEAVLAGPDGPSIAAAYGWTPPYPAVGPLLRRRLWAETVADRLVAHGYAALSVAQRQEFLELLRAADDAATASG